jgi:hypothetical protein
MGDQENKREEKREEKRSEGKRRRKEGYLEGVDGICERDERAAERLAGAVVKHLEIGDWPSGRCEVGAELVVGRRIRQVAHEDPPRFHEQRDISLGRCRRRVKERRGGGVANGHRFACFGGLCTSQCWAPGRSAGRVSMIGCLLLIIALFFLRFFSIALISSGFSFPIVLILCFSFAFLFVVGFLSLYLVAFFLVLFS